MKKLITVRADDFIKEMTNITFPIIKSFAKKWNAEFIELNHEPPVMTDDNGSYFRIMKLYDLFNDYDRILNFDADIIINKSCPNIFDVVPYEKVGSIYEDRGTRRENRLKRIASIQKDYGNIQWSTDYVNSGVFLTSKCHRDIFTTIDGKYYTGDGSDDVHLGYQIHKLKFPIFELSYKFNHMTMFSEKWNNYANRFDSHIIHYAGKGIFDANVENGLKQIKTDAKRIYGEPLCLNIA